MQATPHQALERPEIIDQRIALVFQIQFEQLGRKDGRATRRPGVPSREGYCRAFEQEEAADTSFAIARQPKAILVAADEKRRDRCVQDIGVEGLKRHRRRRTLRNLRQIWACERHGDHDGSSLVCGARPGSLGLARRPPDPRAGKRIEHSAQNGLHVRKDCSQENDPKPHYHLPIRL